MRGGCMKDGQYDLGGQRVVVKDGAVCQLEKWKISGKCLNI